MRTPQPAGPQETRAATAGGLVEELARRFETAWERAANDGPPDLDAFLPPPGVPVRQMALFRLIAVDIAGRWRFRQGVPLEDYLDRIPELGPADQLPSWLIVAEYRARQADGDRPDLPSYRKRFPAQFAAVAQFAATEAALTPAAPAPTARPQTTEYAPGGARVMSPGGDYRMLDRLGSGGFGTVWKAEAPGGVEVAVKVVHRPSGHETHERERQALDLIKRLRHPYLLQTHAFWPQEELLLIVMELADSSLRGVLAERLATREPVPVADLLLWFREAAEALDYLHRERVLHRDIKPDNLLLSQGHMKVADFGLARLARDDEIEASSAGTPGYMAPEVWRGEVSEKSDQYALAVSYAELRLGRSLFEFRNLLDAMTAHFEQEPDLSDLPEAEANALRRALAKEPADRYPSCAEFVAAIREAVYPSPLPAVVRRRPLLWAGIVGALLVAVGLGGWALRPVPAPSPPPGPWLPAGCEPAADASVAEVNGRPLYRHIVADRGGERAEFVLVTPMGRPAFYTMRTKVWIGLYRKFAAEAEPPVGKDWERGGHKAGPNDEPADVGTADPTLPVFRVGVEDARRCALWLGGDLPTIDQWDAAAGRADPPPGCGPYRPWPDAGPDCPPTGKMPADWIAVNRFPGGPMPTGTAPGDVSVAGVTDLAGNGREWTRNARTKSDQPRLLPLSPAERNFVVLRGRSYAAELPYQFADADIPEEIEHDKVDPTVSFRVVIAPGE